uniref:Uncharacterized protein n=1 Tax=Rhizophora mucronata TaxID=61149 RepID=A0A2P2J2G9_RHIMU
MQLRNIFESRKRSKLIKIETFHGKNVVRWYKPIHINVTLCKSRTIL